MEDTDVPEVEQSSFLFNCPPNCTCSRHTYTSPYVCDKCKSDFRSETDLELHLLLNLTNITCKDFSEPVKPKLASKEKIICPACGLVRSKRNQPRHLKFHCAGTAKNRPKPPKIPCPGCGQLRSTKNQLRHLQKFCKGVRKLLSSDPE